MRVTVGSRAPHSNALRGLRLTLDEESEKLLVVGTNTTPIAEQNSTILVVEDDRMVRRAICRLIQNEGYSTLEAGSVSAAMQVLSTQSPSLIVTDLNLSGSSGWTLIARVMATPELDDLPIIVLTGDPEGDPERGKVVPFPRRLTTVLKPFSPNQLLAAVRGFCGPPPVAESGIRRTAAGIAANVPDLVDEIRVRRRGGA